MLDRRELRVLDVGMGTGLFLGEASERAGGRVVPFGIDLAENMLEVARRKMPGLEAMAGDASNLETYFPGQEFDCVCTHFVTGYVAMSVLAPQIAQELKPGGYWSLVGGTKEAYSGLQAKGDSKLLRWLSGVGSRGVDDTVLNPANLAEVSKTMAAPRPGSPPRRNVRARTKLRGFRHLHGVRLSRRLAHAPYREYGFAQGRTGEAMADQSSRVPGQGCTQHRARPGPKALNGNRIGLSRGTWRDETPIIGTIVSGPTSRATLNF